MSDIKDDFILNFIVQDRWKFIVSGLKNTLIITFFALILGVVLGIIVAIIRSSYDKTYGDMRKGLKKTLFAIINGICNVYLTVIRGTPVTVQLMIMYYIIFASSRNSLMVAIIAFGINSGAYVAEIVRSGIMSIDEGQFEAGRSLGFNYKSSMWYIIIPQAFKNVLPALANEFIVLLKETSVAGYVTIRDLTMGGNIIRAATYSAFMPLIAVAIIYLVMVMFFTWLVGLLERRLRKSER
ncbi:MAG: amino acid ABC transporter permease [Clostridia bacterium]|nr:amino acid ABC transporter permease [Clostridia bacterium]